MENTRGLKVLIAAMSLDIGGAETHIAELCKGLARLGVSVFVVSNGGAYESRLKDAGVAHFKAPLHNKNLINLVISYFVLKKVIIENNISLMHAHARIPAFLCGLLKKKLGLKLVTTAHGSFKTRFPYNRLSNWGDVSLAVSQDLADYLIKNYKVKSENIIITANGIDTDFFAPQKPPLNTRGIILCVTRLDREPAKIAAPLMEAARLLRGRGKIVKIVIVGGGDALCDIKNMACAYNERAGEDFIEITGPQTNVRDYLADAGCFVGISRAALEALSFGLPVVLAGAYGYLGVFGENALKPAVLTNFTCRGFDEPVPERLAQDIETLLNETPEERKARADFGRSVVINGYSAQKMALDALTAYKRASEEKQTFCLFGYYGAGNIGDDLLLHSVIDDVRACAPNAEITVFSRSPAATAKAHNVKTVYLFDVLKIKRCLSRARFVLAGGGTLLQDVTSSRSLLYYLSVIKWAKERGGAFVFLYANGIGPLRREKNVKKVRDILPLVDLATLRDAQSLELYTRLGGKNAYKTADAAFSYKRPPNFSRGYEIRKPYFVVALRKWKKLSKNDYLNIARFCEHFCVQRGFFCVFLPMQPANDARVSERVFSLVKSDNKMFVRNVKNPAAAQDLLCEAAFVLSMRLHAVIFALLSYNPSIAIGDDPKIVSIMNETHMPLFSNGGFELNDLISAGAGLAERPCTQGASLKRAVDAQTQLSKQNAAYLNEELRKIKTDI